MDNMEALWLGITAGRDLIAVVSALGRDMVDIGVIQEPKSGTTSLNDVGILKEEKKDQLCGGEASNK